ncbi:MAG: hypothetical protein ACO3LO_04090 [Ilumatobacteraceae bacterium]
MSGIQVQVGGRTRAFGCLIVFLPLLMILGVGFAFWAFARMIGDAILPAGSSGFSEALAGIVVIWLLLKFRRRLKARRRAQSMTDDNRPTPPGVIDI